MAMDDPHHHNNQTSISFLTKGSKVEVSSHEDGFNGAWYSATVIYPPPSISSPNQPTSNSLVYVEYHNLLSEDNSSNRLREYANISYVRPAPVIDTNPPNFELNDLVDAFYRDGWWTGVITAVVDASNFVVTFQNPPDEIQFRCSDLRIHKKWIGGRWVQPQKQVTSGWMFTVGKKVEVSFESESLLDVWFPATVLKNSGNSTFLVEYQQRGAGDEAILNIVTVDYHHIRPSPPYLKDKNFDLKEKVYAYYDFGWWCGVITKVLADNRYNVLFKHTKKEREFIYSKVRPHMEWKEGKWFNTSQGGTAVKKTRSLMGNRIEQATRIIANQPLIPTIILKRRRQKNLDSNDKTSPNDEIMNDVTKSLPLVVMGLQCNAVTVSQGKTVQKPPDENTSDVSKSDPTQPDVPLAPSTVVNQEVSEGDAASVALKRKRGRASKTPVKVNHEIESVVSSTLSGEEAGQRKEVELTTSSGTESLEENQEPANEQPGEHKDKVPNENAGQDLHVQLARKTKKHTAKKGKRGKRRKISVNTESPVQVSQDASKEKADGSLEKDSTRNLEASVEKSPDTMPGDQPLSEGNHSPVTINAPEGTVEESSSKASEGLLNSGSLPFIRNMALWRTLESMEAFRKLPQKPHFCPLLEGVKEGAREGLAIGSMVTFATVFDQTCSLKFDDQRSAIEDCLETLVELESNGFDVEVIRKRLTGLLVIKDKHEELEEKSKGFVEEFEENNIQEKKIEEEIEEINTQMKELEERRKHALLKKEKRISEIGAMEAVIEGTKQEIREVSAEFDGLAAAPFVANNNI